MEEYFRSNNYEKITVIFRKNGYGKRYYRIKKLQKEIDDLRNKLYRLKSYIISDDEFLELSDKARELLLRQKEIMTDYVFILYERIKLLEGEDNEEYKEVK